MRVHKGKTYEIELRSTGDITFRPIETPAACATEIDVREKLWRLRCSRCFGCHSAGIGGSQGSATLRERAPRRPPWPRLARTRHSGWRPRVAAHRLTRTRIPELRGPANHSRHAPGVPRGPLVDRLYLPTADGGRAVTDALIETYHLANSGRALAGGSACRQAREPAQSRKDTNRKEKGRPVGGE